MGGCAEKRNKSNPKDSLTSFEERLGAYAVPWRALVNAAITYSLDGCSIPSVNLAKIFSEAGMGEAYKDETTKLRVLIAEFLQYKESQVLSLILFALLMCEGEPEEKCKFLIQKLNNMNPDIAVVDNAKLKSALEELMELAGILIPKFTGAKEFGKYKNTNVVYATSIWFPYFNCEAVPSENIKRWILGERRFYTSIARDSALKSQHALPSTILTEPEEPIIEKSVRRRPRGEAETPVPQVEVTCEPTPKSSTIVYHIPRLTKSPGEPDIWQNVERHSVNEKDRAIVDQIIQGPRGSYHS
eukprot:TRINITY_DN9902_c0_g1_i1.p2 TRINITY_DN9902_c0_g1~~TRINITY_DN9902_c0_g1_i1.p2  ORF type:complete len:300 (-),score=30.56 TRINITY_DN9902_c0_g1_i1:1269-2168(-)